MHHEFAHILHQNVEYDAEFEKITPSYSSSWMQMNDETARTKGFITAYASSSADEDFAEMVSIMLTNFSGGLGQYDRECGECDGSRSFA